MDNVAEKLESGFYVGNIFPYCNELYTEVRNLKTEKAGIGSQKKINTEIRTDEIFWINHQEAQSEYIQQYLTFAEELRIHLNRKLFLGLKNFECHYAKYSPGGFYKPHYDNVKGKSNRIITMITYLTPNWNNNNGGELCIHHNNEKLIIPPENGTTVCFVSEDILHEVLLSHKERMAITGWFTI